MRLTLERTVNSVSEGLQTVPKSGAERDRIMLANHERANDFVLTKGEGIIKNGAFEVSLTAPMKMPWPRVILRAYAATERDEGMTVQTLRVRKPAD